MSDRQDPHWLGDIKEAIDWKAISGMRDKLVHQYFGVNWDILWDVVANKLPRLKTQLPGERNS